MALVRLLLIAAIEAFAVIGLGHNIGWLRAGAPVQPSIATHP